MNITLRQIDKIDILTLQDNYFDALMMDNNEIISRSLPIKDGEVKNTLLAEHGFSAKVDITLRGQTRSMLFDFGFSEFGAAYNAEALGVDFSNVEVTALSHGHLDHFGGMKRLVALTGRKDLNLIVHPAVFRTSRYVKVSKQVQFGLPSFTRKKAQEAGLTIVETRGPKTLLNDTLLFLGEIPRKSEFEKGASNLFYKEADTEKQDHIEDDTAIVADIKGKGLVVLSGCAHSGIVNSVSYAREVTGREKVYVVMGGFHLTGPAMAPAVAPTVDALKKIDPDYIVPTHCTGRSAILAIEKEMPDKFILNMTGTKLTF